MLRLQNLVAPVYHSEQCTDYSMCLRLDITWLLGYTSFGNWQIAAKLEIVMIVIGTKDG